MFTVKLNESQIRAFFEEGVVLVKGVFSAAETDAMRAAFDRLHTEAQTIRTTQTHRGSHFVLSPKERHVVVNRVVWCGAAEPVLSDFGRDPRLLSMAADLLGSREMQQLINQAHFKMPGDGVSFAFHQDVQHRDKGPGTWKDVNGRGSYVQTLTCVDAMTEDNGPLLWVSGSCRQGPISASGHSYDRDADDPESQSLLEQSQPALGDTGDVILLNPYTLHGSLANRSNSARRIFINGYAYPGANGRVYPGEGSGRMLKI
jgi:ectoine hydroxylase-related dioxygenase (phytanoyl-CoA dioxygenase family)